MADLHVTLYSGPESEEMDAARKFLKNMGVQYEEKSILDSGARGELIHHTRKFEYPAINVDGHFCSGFFEKKWEHLLKPGHLGRT